MRILISVPEQDRSSGNWVSARRYQEGLENLSHQVRLLGVSPQDKAQLDEHLREFSPDSVLLLHAYRSGRPWLSTLQERQQPYAVMLTGTDINGGFEDPQQHTVIESVIRDAAAVLLQNPLLADRLTTRDPRLAEKLHIITPGVSLGTAAYPLRHRHHIDQDATLFLCPAGLRPVKQQRELLPIFDRALDNTRKLRLVFCGPVLDRPYGEGFLADLADRPWASYIGTIPQPAMAAAMSGVDVVVNNSLAEGLPNSLVEAATLGIPILARRNPGNAGVVTHNENGLLFDRDAEGARHIIDLCDQNNRKRLSRPSRDFVSTAEASALERILRDIIKTSQREGGSL